jgi:soluble lytic murein transglycosylase
VIVISLRRLWPFVIALVIVICALYVLQSKWFWKICYPWPYRSEITQVAKRLDIDPYLLVALVRVESGFNVNAVSAAGARGLMQLMPETASWTAEQIGIQDFHESQLDQPGVNLLIGSWYLAHLFKDFHGNQVSGLAAYNAGRGNVQSWLENGQWKGTMADVDHVPFPETQLYLRAVMRDYDIYKYLYAEQDAKTSLPGGT